MDNNVVENPIICLKNSNSGEIKFGVPIDEEFSDSENLLASVLWIPDYRAETILKNEHTSICSSYFNLNEVVQLKNGTDNVSGFVKSVHKMFDGIVLGSQEILMNLSCDTLENDMITDSFIYENSLFVLLDGWVGTVFANDLLIDVKTLAIISFDDGACMEFPAYFLRYFVDSVQPITSYSFYSPIVGQLLEGDARFLQLASSRKWTVETERHNESWLIQQHEKCIVRIVVDQLCITRIDHVYWRYYLGCKNDTACRPLLPDKSVEGEALSRMFILQSQNLPSNVRHRLGDRCLVRVPAGALVVRCDPKKVSSFYHKLNECKGDIPPGWPSYRVGSTTASKPLSQRLLFSATANSSYNEAQRQAAFCYDRRRFLNKRRPYVTRVQRLLFDSASFARTAECPTVSEQCGPCVLVPEITLHSNDLAPIMLIRIRISVLVQWYDGRQERVAAEDLKPVNPDNLWHDELDSFFRPGEFVKCSAKPSSSEVKLSDSNATTMRFGVVTETHFHNRLFIVQWLHDSPLEKPPVPVGSPESLSIYDIKHHLLLNYLELNEFVILLPLSAAALERTLVGAEVFRQHFLGRVLCQETNGQVRVKLLSGEEQLWDFCSVLRVQERRISHVLKLVGLRNMNNYDGLGLLNVKSEDSAIVVDDLELEQDYADDGFDIWKELAAMKDDFSYVLDDSDMEPHFSDIEMNLRKNGIHNWSPINDILSAEEHLLMIDWGFHCKPNYFRVSDDYKNRFNATSSEFVDVVKMFHLNGELDHEYNKFESSQLHCKNSPGFFHNLLYVVHYAQALHIFWTQSDVSQLPSSMKIDLQCAAEKCAVDLIYFVFGSLVTLLEMSGEVVMQFCGRQESILRLGQSLRMNDNQIEHNSFVWNSGLDGQLATFLSEMNILAMDQFALIFDRIKQLDFMDLIDMTYSVEDIVARFRESRCFDFGTERRPQKIYEILEEIDNIQSSPREKSTFCLNPDAREFIPNDQIEHLTGKAAQVAAVAAVQADELPEFQKGSFEILETAPSNHHFYSLNNNHCKHHTEFIRAWGRDIKLLRTNLPSGFCVKSYEDRLELFNIMIQGPMSTPFQDGLFFFDVFLPPVYPREPPKFFFHHLTPGTKINPNLYEDGKVCVSLLGTWEGDATERWDSDRSTLLQVLISIQGLILVPEPWYNEPGFESVQRREESRAYNEMVVLRVAQGLFKIMHDHPAVFRTEVVNYYAHHGSRIVARLKRWAQCDLNSVDKLAEDINCGFLLFPVSRGFQLSLEKVLTSIEEAVNTKKSENGNDVWSDTRHWENCSYVEASSEANADVIMQQEQLMAIKK